jgi:hypothetical protein
MTCAATTLTGYYACEAPAFGSPAFNPNDPNAGAIQAAVAQSVPAGIPNASAYKIACEAMLRAGRLFYQKSTPGDCGSPSALPGITSGQITGLAGTGASALTGVIGAAGIIGGAATLGITSAISVAVAGIEDIFAHHAQAVANEQDTICRVMLYFNGAKQSIDSAVRNAQISSDAGMAYLKQVIQSAKTGLQTIVKTCNAACWYIGYLNAFSNYSTTWYDTIAPTNVIFAQAPGGPPTGMGTPPGGVTVMPGNPAPAPPIRSLPSNTYTPAIQASAPSLTSNNQLPGNPLGSDYLNRGYNQQTGSSAQAADVPPSKIDWTMIAAIVAVITLLVLVAR